MSELVSVENFEKAHPELETSAVLGAYTTYLAGAKKELAAENGISVDELHLLPAERALPYEEVPTAAS